MGKNHSHQACHGHSFVCPLCGSAWCQDKRVCHIRWDSSFGSSGSSHYLLRYPKKRNSMRLKWPIFKQNLFLISAYVLVWSFIFIEKTKGNQRSNALNFTFWGLISTTSTITMTSAVRFPEKWKSPDNIITIVFFTINIIMFFLEFAPNPKLNIVDNQEERGKVI